MAERKSLWLSIGLIAFNLGILTVTFFYPFLYPIMLLVLIPTTAYLGLRTRWMGLALCGAATAALAALVNRTYVYALLGLYGFGVAGAMMALGKKVYKGFAISCAGITIGLICILGVVAAAYRMNPMDAAAEFIRTSESPVILRMARENEIRYRLAERDIPSSELKAERARIAEEVNALDTDYVLNRFAAEVRYQLYAKLMTWFGIAVPLIAASSLWLTTVLARLFQKNFTERRLRFVRNLVYDITPLNEWQTPKGYILGTFPLMILLFLTAQGTDSDFMRMVYSASYNMLVMVPFSISGISIIAYLFTRKGKHTVWAVLTVLVLGVFLYPFFAVLGVCDHLLHTRKLIKLIDETDSI